VLAAVILSGGASRRMGSPKALLSFRAVQGKTFLEHLLSVIQHPKISARRVVLGPDAEAIAKAVPLDREDVVINPDWELGQLSSIHAALRSLPVGTDGMLLSLIDHPLITAALVGELIEEFYESRAAIVLPIFQGRRGHPVIFSARLYDEMLAAPMDVGARAVVWAHRAEVREYETAEAGCVLNLNDPEAVRRMSEGQ
jgi:molybdenum cofactor cytidylyltransferase